MKGKNKQKQSEELSKIATKCLVVAVILLALGIIVTVKCRIDYLEKQAQYDQMIQEWQNDWQNPFGRTFVCPKCGAGLEAECKIGLLLMNLVGSIISIVGVVLGVVCLRRKNKARKTKIVFGLNIVLLILEICLLIFFGG